VTGWRWADPATVRATIGSRCARAASVDSELGDVTLRSHQRDAASRLRHAIESHGGALLADDVGLGKTYTALAAARGFEPILIVAPAALAEMWRRALATSRTTADFVSFESLSRSASVESRHPLVIVDEAHHARNRLTRRYARLAELTRASKVLLLSATPLHNTTSDLHALLALFLGSRADRLGPEQLAICIVRRTHHEIRGDAKLPHRTPPTWLDVDGSPELLQALVDVPPPCPPRDGGDGGALVTLSLVRAWASTEGALRSTLRRRLARANALTDALAIGRHPTRTELRAWVVGDDATQLAFPELMVDAISADWRALSDSVGRHAAGLRRALDALAGCDGRIDDARCAMLRDVRRRHPTERVVVFSHFADSVRAMFDRLRGDGRVAAVTANGAWLAGGPITRSDALARFTATTQADSSRRYADVIEMLIATDLLSEGLNLQNASVVVHLDLPWTAARLTQRVGRVWRMTSPHARIHEYAISPPTPAEQLLRVIDILQRKAGAATAALGDAVAPLLAGRTVVAGSASDNPVTARESLLRRLHAWNDVAVGAVSLPCRPRDDAAPSSVIVAAVRAAVDGWIALVSDAAGPRLVARHGEASPTSSPETVLAIIRAAEGATSVASPSRVERTLRDLEAFLDAHRAAADAGVAEVGFRTHSAAAGRIAALAARAPAHRRVAVSRLAASARTAVDRARTAGSERLLRALLATNADEDATGDAGESWLARLAALDPTPDRHPAPTAPAPTRIDALIVLVPQR
jgi:hypothetical protein